MTGLAGDVRAGLIDGIHLEGPWLSTLRCGAHAPSLMRDPDPAEIDRVLDAAAGALRMITIAPERDGALAAIGRIVDAGVVAAVGHTEATYEQTRAAIAAGATVGTHLFNAMRPINTREPGPVIALLEDPRVTVELITDGVHVDPALYRHVSRSAGPDRVSLITDAISAAGMTDGTYHLGPLAVDVRGRRGARGRNADNRRQHRDHGPPVPLRREPQSAVARRGADVRGASGIDQPGARPGAAGQRAAFPEAPLTLWCWTRTSR